MDAALVLLDVLRERHEHGADGGGLVAGALRAVFVGLAPGHRALMLHEPDVEGGTSEPFRPLDRNELDCHLLFPLLLFCIVAARTGCAPPSPPHPRRGNSFVRPREDAPQS